MTKPPFFLLGAQRSGTTMLRLMMNAHPELCVPFESAFIVDFSRNLAAYNNLDSLEDRRRLIKDVSNHPFVIKGQLIPNPDAVDPASFDSYAGFLDKIFSDYATAKGKLRWGDKTPGYTTELDVLNRLFPDAFFIHLIRDGRGVAESIRRLSWGKRNLPAIARDWQWKNLLCKKLGNMVPGRYMLVKYEDLVLDTESTLRAICEFIQHDYDPSMLDYSASAKSEMPKESMKWHSASVSPVDVQKLSSWRKSMTISDQLIFDEHAMEALVEFDYGRCEAHPGLMKKLRELYYCTIARW